MSKEVCLCHLVDLPYEIQIDRSCDASYFKSKLPLWVSENRII